MAETLPIVSERVDDVPLLLAELDHMGVQPLLDKHFPTPGNWVGLSLGWVTGDCGVIDPHPVRGGPSAEPCGTLGPTTPPHAAGVHRPAGAPIGCRRRPTGNREGQRGQVSQPSTHHSWKAESSVHA